MNKKTLAIILAFTAILLTGCGSFFPFGANLSRGYRNYKVQKEQYNVLYSEEFDYWDVLTVEYPQLKGISEPQAEQINELLYDTAMDRVNYWHLKPDKKVRRLQKEYSIFSSDVWCDVSYHSQYLLSVDYHEIYAPIDPVAHVRFTERAVNVDLETGENYALSDVFRVDKDFMRLWCKSAHKKYGDDIPCDDESVEIFLSWFLDEDEEMKEGYELRSFFYITEDKEFVIGLAIDPKAETLTGGRPDGDIYSVLLTKEVLEPYRTKSEFWRKYENSKSEGQVLECKDPTENLWLGENGSVWGYWEDR